MFEEIKCLRQRECLIKMLEVGRYANSLSGRYGAPELLSGKKTENVLREVEGLNYELPIKIEGSETSDSTLKNLLA